MPTRIIRVPTYLKSLGLKVPPANAIEGQEDNVGENAVVPLLRALGYQADDIVRKPQISHAILGARREPDYGVYRYSSARGPLYGMVVDVKASHETLTLRMEEKLAGYCGLAGAEYGLLCNGRDLIVLRPTRGVVAWEYMAKIPDRQSLIRAINRAPKEYDEPSIVYAARITNILRAQDVTGLARRFHDMIRSRKGMAVPDRLYEFSKLLVVRIMDELEYKRGNQSELYLTAQALDRLKSLGVGVKAHLHSRFGKVREQIGIFKAGESVDLPEDLVDQMIRELDQLALWSEKLDVLGQVYEEFLQNTMTGQELGQYFTPRSVVEAIVQMLDLRQGQSVLDPACGSGGFLIYTLVYLCEKHRAQTDDERRALAGPLRGIDIFDNAAALCQINLWLHGDCHDNVVRGDSLKASEAPAFLMQALTDPAKHGFDVILTNPPFGAKEGTRLTSEVAKALCDGWQKQGVDLFECATPGRGLQPQSPFVELCVKALRKPSCPGKGGRLAIILDNGMLSNINREEPRIREIIRRECAIEAVVGLPKGTFKPYGSNVIPCFLLLRRRHPSERQGPIFRAEISRIGFVPGYTRYKEADGSDLGALVRHWRKWNEK